MKRFSQRKEPTRGRKDDRIAFSQGLLGGCDHPAGTYRKAAAHFKCIKELVSQGRGLFGPQNLEGLIDDLVIERTPEGAVVVLTKVGAGPAIIGAELTKLGEHVEPPRATDGNSLLTRELIAKRLQVSRRTVDRVFAVLRYGDVVIHRRLSEGRISINRAHEEAMELRVQKRELDSTSNPTRGNLVRTLSIFLRLSITEGGQYRDWTEGDVNLFELLVQRLQRSGCIDDDQLEVLRQRVEEKRQALCV